MSHTIKMRSPGLIEAKIVGAGGADVAKKFVDDADALLAEHQGEELNAIVDMTQAGLFDYAGIKVFKTFLETVPVKKLAFVVTNGVVKSFINLAIDTSGKDFAHFETEEEALTWLA